MVASHHRMRRRVLTLATAVITVLPIVGLVAPAGALAAPPTPGGSCTASVRGKIDYTTGVTSKGYARAKNDVVYTIAPGQTSGSRTITSTTTFSGSITFSGSTTFSTGIVIAEAEATLGLQLQIGAAFASGDSWTVGPYKNTTTGYRDAVAYAGTRKVVGQVSKWKCDTNPSTGFITWVRQSTANFTAWDQVLVGMLWCNDDAKIKSTYGSWSMQYDAVSKC
jgi:hypothetical protein